MDNTAVLSYLLTVGGTKNKSLIKMIKEIWIYLINNQITNTAEYHPEKLNVRAHWQSRHSKNSSAWMLQRTVFLEICNNLGHPEIDLFASHLSHQLPQYYTCKPDPHSLETTALQQIWGQYPFYVFPPFCLIQRIFNKIRR